MGLALLFLGGRHDTTNPKELCESQTKGLENPYFS